MKRFFLMLLATVSLVACDKEGDDGSPKSIVVPNAQHLTQTVYADDNAGNSGVTFKTTGAWTSEIKESATAKSTRTAMDWVSISPSSGDKAGNYTISISLLTNFTGEKRSATISLKCRGEIVNIVITQDAVTELGEKPKPDLKPSGSGTLKNETTGESVKLVLMKHEIENPEKVRIKFFGEGEKGVEFGADFYNPLQSGKLQSGVYNIKLFNTYPVPEKVNGDCEWYKSSLGDYGTSGTIKVEINNDIYTFTFSIQMGTTKLTGSFTGVPEYVNKEVKVESISLNHTSKTLEMGTNFSLTATILPENATDKRYTWSSSNPAVATVSESGLVQSVAKGTTTITATSQNGSKTATCSVTVNPPVAVTDIKVEPAEVTITEGESIVFYSEEKIKVLPQNATNKKISWKSSNEKIADYTGKEIQAHAAGVATITFTTEDGSKTATLIVTVTERVLLGNGTIKTSTKSGEVVSEYTISNVNRTFVSKDEVRLDFMDKKNQKVSELTFYNLIENGNLKLGTYTILDHIGSVTGVNRYGYVKSAMWGRPASTGGTYMYFYKTGSVTVAKLGDNYTITFNNVKTNSTDGFDSENVACSFSGKFTSINEYVPVSSVALDKTSLSLVIGGSSQLTATVNPSNAFNKKVTWSSSNTNIVNVDQRGYVWASGVGSATITVSTEDGAKTASCVITVNALPETGNGTFSNNNSQSVSIKRAEQWVNEKDPKEIDLRFYSTSLSPNLSFTLVRGDGDTGKLKAGTYAATRLMADGLGVKFSNSNTGSVTVALSGDQYTVTLNLTAEGGTKITGTYTGKISNQ